MNRTLKSPLVEHLPKPTSLPGKEVVVFEAVPGGGRAFRELLPPEGRFREKWTDRIFGKSDDLTAYAVAKGRTYCHVSTRDHPSSDQAGELTVTLRLFVAATDSRLLTSMIEDDPLWQIEEAASRAAGRAVSELTWAEIRSLGSPSLESELTARMGLAADGGRLPAGHDLEHEAGGYGLQLDRIEITYSLPESDRAPRKEVVSITGRRPVIEAQADHDKRELELKQEIARREEELEQIRADSARYRKFLDRAAETMGNMIETVSSSIDDVPDLRAALAEVQTLRTDFRQLAPMSQDSAIAPPSSTPQLTAGARSDALGKRVEAVLSAAHQIGSPERSRRLTAAALKLLGEALLGDAASDDDLKKQRDLIAAGLKELAEERALRDEVQLALSPLCKSGELKAELRDWRA